jgi:hypothetical protein
MIYISVGGEARFAPVRGRERQIASITLFLFIFAGACMGERRCAD